MKDMIWTDIQELAKRPYLHEWLTAAPLEGTLPVDQNSGHLEETVMAKTLPISEVKTRLPELVTGVEEREEEVVVTRKGKPAAVLVNYSEYERLKETLDVLGDPALMRQIRRSQKFYSQGRQGLTFEEVFSEPLQPGKKRKR